ncbi:Tetracycline repressor protein class B from transposon Tn10 [Actinoplanes sp. SE50]|uniref:TetR/AcrR family transcriptional regulator n=1 Tax=unclassified Actinoplanes TaxID=2626549 RepID=UPI00023EC6BE|nr:MULTISPECIES: TetR/AcrR family transcriptional regulator C-terminal domain-containing protein [unclassified Actinoplanes]AEV87047.1 Tetracycline repressor protein class B from transposon Tn10 [Actinoplanes sp. SE50/110]ATO85445.1 Tetracycline repressor protein class B from transposon Tn10 [Actinoplanes sp. SE50]SLM02857.1 TetR family transcriptional regulator [Actinoplanes sp. SE50/110]
MQPAVPPRRAKLGRPARITQEMIAARAQAIVDAEGVQHLSMRRLSRELETTPMALYHYVRDRDALLLMLLATKTESTPLPHFPAEPRDYLLAAAVHLHHLLDGCPWLPEILGSQELVGVVTLPAVEHLLEAAIRCGLDRQEAVELYQLLWSFVAGELFINAGTRKPEQPSRRQRLLTTLPAEEYPHLAALSEQWGELIAGDHVHRGLAGIIDGVLRDRSGPSQDG